MLFQKYFVMLHLLVDSTIKAEKESTSKKTRQILGG